ncbi:MAG: hypothetical protein M9888_03290 [Chitinophagales bacterium]|nr:hypothetical protein [Chitinophagales bacterium]
MNLSGKSALRGITRIASVISGIALAIVILLPIWRIELDAPQYPEGLEMYIYANKLEGDVEIINGLNHYIGMQELHAENFIEFTVLPYILGFFAFWALLVAFINKRCFFYSWAIGFVLFGILSMVDFYKWLYDYGHNLDPKAPIQVPGMTYQPPLIGFKQLLNFGAYSIPDIGGWLMGGVGVMIAAVFVTEFLSSKKS